MSLIGGLLIGFTIALVKAENLKEAIGVVFICLVTFGFIFGGITLYDAYQDRQYKLQHDLVLTGEVVKVVHTMTHTDITLRDPWTTYGDPDSIGFARVSISVNGTMKHNYRRIKVKGIHDIPVNQSYRIIYNEVTHEVKEITLKEPGKTPEKSTTITWGITGYSGN